MEEYIEHVRTSSVFLETLYESPFVLHLLVLLAYASGPKM